MPINTFIVLFFQIIILCSSCITHSSTFQEFEAYLVKQESDVESLQQKYSEEFEQIRASLDEIDTNQYFETKFNVQLITEELAENYSQSLIVEPFIFYPMDKVLNCVVSSCYGCVKGERRELGNHLISFLTEKLQRHRKSVDISDREMLALVGAIAKTLVKVPHGGFPPFPKSFYGDPADIVIDSNNTCREQCALARELLNSIGFSSRISKLDSIGLNAYKVSFLLIAGVGVIYNYFTSDPNYTFFLGLEAITTLIASFPGHRSLIVEIADERLVLDLHYGLSRTNRSLLLVKYN